MDSLLRRVEDVRRRVALAAERVGRDPSEVRIVAVSKGVAPEEVSRVYNLGLREFGENRVQELREKSDALRASGATPVWHMIGHLQSNKAKLAGALSDIIESVGSLRIAQVLDCVAGESGTKLAVLLQVDYSSDPGRNGFKPSELESLSAELVALNNLEIQGLMTVAPLGLDADGVRGVFRRLRADRDRLASRHPRVEWRHISMGMSDDFELAVEEGATIVRIGRAIFGERPRFKRD